MSEHTPGPWSFDKELFFIRGKDGKQIVCDLDTGNDDQAAIDGALIAAAPDLLAALKEVVRISDRKHDAWDAAHAALARATGVES